MEYEIHTQRREWYGDENHIGEAGYGRYKNKGCQSFVFADINKSGSILCHEDELKVKFNSEFNKVGNFFRYEAIEITHFNPSTKLNFDGEKFSIA